MASNVEMESLDEINYNKTNKIYVYILIVMALFLMGFISFFPLGNRIKSLTHHFLKGSPCLPDWKSLEVEWLLPKIVVKDLQLPSSCFQKQRKPLLFDHLHIHFRLVSFSPFGIPFRIDTEINKQPFSIYFIQSIGKRYIRIKDQDISLAKISSLIKNDLKLEGDLKLDLSLLISNLNLLKEIHLKALSNNLEIPAQNLSGFSIPPIKLRNFIAEMDLNALPRLVIRELKLGDTESSVRADFSGNIDIYQNNPEHSQLNINGKVSFSEQFKNNVPVDLIFQNYDQIDGFYQLRIGGSLSHPKLTNP